MSKKLSDFKDKERSKIIDDITKRVGTIGLETWYDDGVKAFVGGDGFGLCQSCLNLRIVKSKYAIKCADCSMVDNLHLSSDDPIIECSNYSKRGELTLQVMFSLATIIEPAKNKAGF